MRFSAAERRVSHSASVNAPLTPLHRLNAASASSSQSHLFSASDFCAKTFGFRTTTPAYLSPQLLVKRAAHRFTHLLHFFHSNINIMLVVLRVRAEVHVPALAHALHSALDVLAHAAFEQAAFVLREQSARPDAGNNLASALHDHQYFAVVAVVLLLLLPVCCSFFVLLLLLLLFLIKLVIIVYLALLTLSLTLRLSRVPVLSQTTFTRTRTCSCCCAFILNFLTVFHLSLQLLLFHLLIPGILRLRHQIPKLPLVKSCRGRSANLQQLLTEQFSEITIVAVDARIDVLRLCPFRAFFVHVFRMQVADPGNEVSVRSGELLELRSLALGLQRLSTCFFVCGRYSYSITLLNLNRNTLPKCLPDKRFSVIPHNGVADLLTLGLQCFVLGVLVLFFTLSITIGRCRY